MISAETTVQPAQNMHMEKHRIPFNRILIVDDSEVDFFIANKLIKRHKPSALLYYANSVDSALHLLRTCDTSEAPDLILLDLNFDRQAKQGIDFLYEFRNLQKVFSKNIKVIALTAYSRFKEGRAVENDLSLTEILEKPFSVDKLMIC